MTDHIDPDDQPVEVINPRDFDPTRFLTKVSGADYLEVKWRLLWLRFFDPHAALETELITHDGQAAIFKAKITLSDVFDPKTGVIIRRGGSATGFGSEQYGDFRDYIEKAETKAIGRACAALGFGTQFAKDFDFGSDQNRVVDAPVDLQRQLERRRQNPPSGQSEQRSSDQPATSRQHGFITALQGELGITDAALKLECESSFGSPVSGLSRRDASVLIERLQARRAEGPVAAKPAPAAKPDAPIDLQRQPEPESAGVRFSGFSRAEIVESLNLNAKDAEQKQEWAAEIVSVRDDPSLTPEGKREAIKRMALMAMDGVVIDAKQHWRFSVLAQNAVDETQLDGIETAFANTKSSVGANYVKGSVAERRRVLRS